MYLDYTIQYIVLLLPVHYEKFSDLITSGLGHGICTQRDYIKKLYHYQI